MTIRDQETEISQRNSSSSSLFSGTYSNSVSVQPFVYSIQKHSGNLLLTNMFQFLLALLNIGLTAYLYRVLVTRQLTTVFSIIPVILIALHLLIHRQGTGLSEIEVYDGASLVEGKLGYKGSWLYLQVITKLIEQYSQRKDIADVSSPQVPVNYFVDALSKMKWLSVYERVWKNLSKFMFIPLCIFLSFLGYAVISLLTEGINHVINSNGEIALYINLVLICAVLILSINQFQGKINPIKSSNVETLLS